MANIKDELISGAELARRLDVSQVYISKAKKDGKLIKCTYGKKFYYRKCSLALGKNPDNPHKTHNSESQKTTTTEKEDNWTVTKGKEEVNQKVNEITKDLKEKKKPRKEIHPVSPPGDNDKEAKTLLQQILLIVNDKDKTLNRAELDGLKLKAGILKEYFAAKNEEIKNRQLVDNLFERDEVLRILGFAMNMIRNALLNLPNNYAVNLEGLGQKQIKEYVSDDINKILTDLQETGKRFDDEQ